MKYLTDSKTTIVFFCDGCGKKLDRKDPGQVRLDVDGLLKHLGTDKENNYQPEFLCNNCASRLDSLNPDSNTKLKRSKRKQKQ